MADEKWVDVGSLEELSQRPLQEVKAGRLPIALSYKDGEFSAVSGVCNHAGGPLGQGRLDGDYVVCPWHNWKFHCRTGLGEPGFEEDAVPRHDTREVDGRLQLNTTPSTKRSKKPHDPHPLTRKLESTDIHIRPIRLLGISTTAMDVDNPRYSTSDDLLETALRTGRERSNVETRLIRLASLDFRACEGYYSKSARACTWPCSITQMDPGDEMEQVYEGIVFWADAIIISTPIRWGGASSLYYKMVERMNCVQNQITTHDRVLIRNKVASFIVTGGQDNIQSVAGEMLGFFAEIGCVFPQFPYIAHSLGWSAEDMEHNQTYVQKSRALHDGAADLALRTIDMVRQLCDHGATPEHVQRAGRKADGVFTSIPARERD